MIDEETLDKIREALPQRPFRTADLSIKLHMRSRKLAYILRILEGLGEVRRVEVRVQLGGGFRTTRSFWRKTA